MPFDIPTALLAFGIFYYSLVLHEVAHGWVAKRFGDPTADLAGRISFNPIVHFDVFSSLMIPVIIFAMTGGAIFFGGVKPTPVTRANLKPKVIGDILVTLAGVLMNILIAVAFGMIYRFAGDSLPPILAAVVRITVASNVLLFFFNLIPLPPFDGGMLVRLLVPTRLKPGFDAIGAWGVLIAVLLLFTPGVGRPFQHVIVTVTDALLG